MNRFELTLDLDKRGGVAQWVTLRQGDRRGTELRATIYDHGVQVGSGYTCRVVIRRPDVAEYYRETCEYSLGVATVTIDEQYAAAISGSTYGYFELLQGGSVIASTESFGVRILPDATADATVGPEYDSAIDDALAELDEATGRITQMVIDATEEYLEAHPELTTTVEDNSLTDAKLIQHGGILDRVAKLWHRLDNLLTATPAESDSLTVTDAAKTPLAGLALYGRSVQDGTPTPDVPVAIQSVTPNLYHFTRQVNGTNVQTSNMSDVSVVDEVLTFTASNNNPYYGSTQSAGQERASAAGFLVPVKEGLTYSLCASNPQMNQFIVTGYNASKVSLGYSSPTVNGGKATYTVPSGAAYITVRIGLTNATSGTTYSTAFAVYEGDQLSVRVPYNSVGLWARGKNLWGYGNHTFTRYVRVNFDTPFPAGTYTVSAVVTSADTDASTSTFTFRDANDIAVGSATLTRNSRASDVVTIARPATYCYLYSSTGASPSTGDTATWADIQVEQGSTATPYQPYVESTTPIDLQGHALRSLPDGTRDEVTVDQYGHATLIQRVGSVDLGTLTWTSASQTGGYRFYTPIFEACRKNADYAVASPVMSESYPAVNGNQIAAGTTGIAINAEPRIVVFDSSKASMSTADFKAAVSGVMLYYPLATPVTIDLGTVDPIALQGPDMTAQSVPTAPFALTYERDLNVTLARLEAAIADAATS